MTMNNENSISSFNDNNFLNNEFFTRKMGNDIFENINLNDLEIENSTLYIKCKVNGTTKTKSNFKDKLKDFVKIKNFSMFIENSVQLNASASIREMRSIEVANISIECIHNPIFMNLLQNWNQGSKETMTLEVARWDPTDTKNNYFLTFEGCVVKDICQMFDANFGFSASFVIQSFKFNGNNLSLSIKQ